MFFQRLRQLHLHQLRQCALRAAHLRVPTWIESPMQKTLRGMKRLPLSGYAVCVKPSSFELLNLKRVLQPEDKQILAETSCSCKHMQASFCDRPIRVLDFKRFRPTKFYKMVSLNLGVGKNVGLWAFTRYKSVSHLIYGMITHLKTIHKSYITIWVINGFMLQ